MKQRHFLHLLSIALCLVFLLSGCGHTEPAAAEGADPEIAIEVQPSAAPEEAPVTPSEPTPEPAAGYDELGGLWAVGGMYYGSRLIDIHDNAALEDLYDSTFLTFNADGTFHYFNLFVSEGKYVPYDNGSNSYLLKVDRTFLYDFVDGELVEKETETGTQTYILTMTDDSKTTFTLCAFDAISGKAKADDDPLLFVADDRESPFIEQNKTPVNTPSEQTVVMGDTPAISSDSSSAAGSRTASPGDMNALETARQYLDIMAFSYDGLVEQLEFDGYTHSQAVYAADNCGADWYDEAARMAAQYLDLMPFSRSELIDQLEFEGLTNAQATYGVQQNGY